ncbi:MAG: hypothetical protein FWD57_12945 [Polyangiaceae bacterium]|nr:hypothetical protein [Polyangiaceae bacterium]
MFFSSGLDVRDVAQQDGTAWNIASLGTLMLRRDRMQPMALGGLAFGSLLGVRHTTRGCGIIAGVGAVGSGSGISGSLDVCV